MGILDRKLLRDFSNMKWQLLAIIAVISCGISTFVLSTSTVDSLETTRANYYAGYRFADLFCDLKRAPESIAQQFSSISDIAHFETRIDIPVRIQVPLAEKSVQGLAISLPVTGEPQLNAVHIRKGRLPEDASSQEVVISEAFANANHIQLGNELTVTLYGRQYALTVVGIALSPEFIYEIAPGGLLPDNRSFGVLWLRRNAIEGSAQLDGAFNHISFTLAKNATRPRAIDKVDQILKPYGSLGAIDRDDQRSHRFVSSEMDELRNMGRVAPTIFLCVSSFLLNMVLSRMIASQREQIAALKAFGFSPWEIGLFYLKFAWSVAIIGAMAGLALGFYLGQGLTEMYSKFFHFPNFSFYVPWNIVLFAILLSLGAATVAVANGIRGIMLLQPAEAMRPEPPLRYGNSFLDAIWKSWNLSTVPKMVLRHSWRNPKRALMSLLGLSLAVSVLILGSFMQDAIYSLFDTMFTASKKYDLQVNFVEPQHSNTFHELHSLEGVLSVNLIRVLPIRAKSQQRERLLSIVGLDQNHQLSPLVDLQNRVVDLPCDGLLMSRKLAEVLQINLGDRMTIEILEGKRATLEIPVLEFIDDAAGETIYMERFRLSELLQETPLATAAYLRIDSNLKSLVISELERRPHVSHVVATADLKQSFLSTIAENVRRMRSINLFFSIVIAIGVIYSTARISIAERSRELATLRVLGFSRFEVTSIIVLELAILTMLAIPMGWLIGYGLSYMTVNAFDRELFRVPFVISISTYSFAAMVVVGAMLGASWLIYGLIGKMNFVDVLKARD
jgi:putative ABC transport system permease protein